MNPIYTFNDTSIEIKIIDEEGNHYKKDIPNNRYVYNKQSLNVFIINIFNLCILNLIIFLNIF